MEKNVRNNVKEALLEVSMYVLKPDSDIDTMDVLINLLEYLNVTEKRIKKLEKQKEEKKMDELIKGAADNILDGTVRFLRESDIEGGNLRSIKKIAFIIEESLTYLEELKKGR